MREALFAVFLLVAACSASVLPQGLVNDTEPMKSTDPGLLPGSEPEMPGAEQENEGAEPEQAESEQAGPEQPAKEPGPKGREADQEQAWPLTEAQYSEMCPAPKGQVPVRTTYGSSFIEYYEVQGSFEGPYWKWRDHNATKLLSLRCYRDGEKDGPAVDWDRNGLVEKELFYKDGGLNGPYRVWSNGVLVEELAYADDEYDGVWSAWTDEGVPKWVKSYKNGDRHGIWKTYYPSGALRDEQEYIGGEKTQNYRLYSEEGWLVTEREGRLEGNRFTGTIISWQEPVNGVRQGEKCTMRQGEKVSCETVAG